MQPPEKSDFSNTNSLDVIKIWKTIQGEGPFAGQPAVFVRLAGCNLQCPNCDTQYTDGRNRIKNEDIIRLIQVQMPPKHMVGNNVVGSLVVLTGGEPFRQQIQELVKRLFDLGYRIQIETNGTYYSERFPYHFTTIVCSPKTGSVHEQLQRHIHHLKYVVAKHKTDPRDGLPTEVLGSPIRVQRPWTDFTGIVYVQPEDEGGTGDPTINLKHAVDICQKFNYVLCLQVHKYAGVE